MLCFGMKKARYKSRLGQTLGYFEQKKSLGKGQDTFEGVRKGYFLPHKSLFWFGEAVEEPGRKNVKVLSMDPGIFFGGLNGHPRILFFSFVWMTMSTRGFALYPIKNGRKELCFLVDYPLGQKSGDVLGGW